MTDTPTPILVNASAVPDITESQIGPLVSAVGGLVLAFGVLTPQKWAAVAGVLPIVLTMAWRWWRAQTKHAQRVTMAEAAPNAVAQVVNKP